MEDQTNREQQDAILRVAAYHRKDLDRCVISFPARSQEAVRTSISTPFPEPPESQLGYLDRLPIEVLSSILRTLDLLSCFRFSQVNRLARAVVHDGVEGYHAISQHAIDCFRALLVTNMAAHITAFQIYVELTAKGCLSCKAPGAWLFLPVASRCCFNCLGTAPDFRAIMLRELSKATKLREKQLRHLLPVILTTPRKYLLESDCKKRGAIVAEAEAIQTLVSLGIWSESQVSDALKLRPHVSQVEFMVSVPFPYLDPETLEVQRGVSCKACEEAAYSEVDNDGDPETWQMFWESDFAGHFEWCEKAQDLWRASREGTVPVETRPLLGNPDGNDC